MITNIWNDLDPKYEDAISTRNIKFRRIEESNVHLGIGIVELIDSVIWG